MKLKAFLLILLLTLSSLWLVCDTYDNHTLVRIEVPTQYEKSIVTRSRMDVVNAGKNWVKAILTDDELSMMETMNLKFEILYDEMASERATRATPGYCSNTPWPCYYTGSTFNIVNPPAGSLMEKLLNLNNSYPGITRLYDIGNSQDGNYDIIAMKVTDNPDIEETEPEIRLYGNIHGDETSSMMVTVDVLDWLLDNYATDSDAQKLINDAELWFIPLGNPWGLMNQDRHNSRGVDLNRNFWGPNGSDEPPEWSETETQAIRDLTEVTGKRFVTSVSTHSGAICFNAIYNYTTAATSDEPIFFESRTGGPEGEADPSPYGLAQAYLDGNTTPGFWYTNGGDWYVTRGDTNDWSYYQWSDLDTTLEITSTKWPDSSQIPVFTGQHRQAVINYILKTFQGISGVMTDGTTGLPLDGTVVATCTTTASYYVTTPHLYKEVFTDPDVGDFHRVLEPGTYTLTCQSSGYTSYDITGLVVEADRTTLANCTWGSPDLSYQSMVIDDSSGGNGDGLLNPGETAVLQITLHNTGSLSATSILGLINTSDPNVTVSDNSASFPDMGSDASGESQPDHYTVTVDAAAPAGDIPFTLNWTALGGHSGSTTFLLPVLAPPVISGISVSNISDNSATVTWLTDIDADSQVDYGTTTSPTSQGSDPAYVTAHTIQLAGLLPCTTYYFSVSSTSEAGIQVTDDNSGSYYTFTTYMDNSIFSDDMESGAALWQTPDSPWAISEEESHSQTHAWSDSPGGSYGSSINISLTSTAVDLSGVTEASLTFWHMYAFETGYDYGYLEISTNGLTWAGLETFNGSETGWKMASYDLASYTGESTVSIRFRITSDINTEMDGWHIDDVKVGPSPSPCVPDAEYSTHEISDTCGSGGPGNADKILDAGETAVITLDIRNSGAGTLTGVSALITTAEPGITVTDDTADYPDIPQGESRDSLSPHFDIQVSDSVTCGTSIDFDLTIYSDQGTFTDTFSQEVGQTLPGGGTPVSEGFEGTFPPTDWNTYETGATDDPGWQLTSTEAHLGTNSAYHNDDNTNGNAISWLVTPQIDLPAAATATALTFWQRDYYQSHYDYHGVWITTGTDPDPSASTYAEIWSGDTGDPWVEQQVDLSGYAGQSIFLAFRYVGDNKDRWYIDDVTVTYTAPGGCNMNTCIVALPPGEVSSSASGSPVELVKDSITCPSGGYCLFHQKMASATGYNIYEGTLGSWYSHDGAPGNACNAVGTDIDPQIQHDLTPTAGDHYYLITAYNGNGEGTAGNGARDTGLSCAP